jgi:hypothetical protein
LTMEHGVFFFCFVGVYVVCVCLFAWRMHIRFYFVVYFVSKYFVFCICVTSSTFQCWV